MNIDKPIKSAVLCLSLSLILCITNASASAASVSAIGKLQGTFTKARNLVVSVGAALALLSASSMFAAAEEEYQLLAVQELSLQQRTIVAEADGISSAIDHRLGLGAGWKLSLAKIDENADFYSGADFGQFEGEVVVDNEGIHFPYLGIYVANIEMPVSRLSHKNKHINKFVIKDWGYQRYDYRTHALTQDDGFVIEQLHIVSLETPYSLFSYELGVGDLGFVKTAKFQHAGLEKWAGEKSDFSYILFNQVKVGIKLPLWGEKKSNWSEEEDWYGYDYHNNSERLRTATSAFGGVHFVYGSTGFGDIDLPDGTDGSFSASRKAINAEIDLFLPHTSEHVDNLSVRLDGSLYQQDINAKLDNGDKFSQSTQGLVIRMRVVAILDFMQ